jgi:hypothetical protein
MSNSLAILVACFCFSVAIASNVESSVATDAPSLQMILLAVVSPNKTSYSVLPYQKKLLVSSYPGTAIGLIIKPAAEDQQAAGRATTLVWGATTRFLDLNWTPNTFSFAQIPAGSPCSPETVPTNVSTLRSECPIPELPNSKALIEATYTSQPVRLLGPSRQARLKKIFLRLFSNYFSSLTFPRIFYSLILILCNLTYRSRKVAYYWQRKRSPLRWWTLMTHLDFSQMNNQS